MIGHPLRPKVLYQEEDSDDALLVGECVGEEEVVKDHRSLEDECVGVVEAEELVLEFLEGRV